jgi:hypothetical protein
VQNYVHKHTHTHDYHFDQTKQKKTTVLYISTYLHDPSLATSYNTRHVCTYGCCAMLSTKLASSLLLWQAIFFFHFKNSVKHHACMSHKITANQMITPFIVSVYSPISQPPTMLLSILNFAHFPSLSPILAPS